MKLPEMEIASCPDCNSSQDVKSKLLAFHPEDSFAAKSFDKYTMSNYTDKNFISALFCSSCDIGVIPECMREELGMSIFLNRSEEKNTTLLREFIIRYWKEENI